MDLSNSSPIALFISRHRIEHVLNDPRTKNLDLPRARAIRKALGIALDSVGELPTDAAQNFARCTLLRTAQWTLDNRKRTISLAEFRARLQCNAHLMLSGLSQLETRLKNPLLPVSCTFVQADAVNLPEHAFFKNDKNQADLVVTSPPYPGIHVLYHRWQVDGRRETPAPYWIADCNDGEGGAFYTFGDRKAAALVGYFRMLRERFRSIRRIMKPGGFVVQMVSFNDRRRHLERYLYSMRSCGFKEVKPACARRIWREVPNRKWHATLKGQTAASREVVLIHQAI